MFRIQYVVIMVSSISSSICNSTSCWEQMRVTLTQWPNRTYVRTYVRTSTLSSALYSTALFVCPLASWAILTSGARRPPDRTENPPIIAKQHRSATTVNKTSAEPWYVPSVRPSVTLLRLAFWTSFAVLSSTGQWPSHRRLTSASFARPRKEKNFPIGRSLPQIQTRELTSLLSKTHPVIICGTVTPPRLAGPGPRKLLRDPHTCSLGSY
jgi:hypothetical protein